MRYPCGCINKIHSLSGVLHNVAKCPKHKRAYHDPATLGEAYYTELGLLQDGQLAKTDHVVQIEEALGPFPGAFGHKSALEVGCGVSPYVRAIHEAGWRYTGVDRSEWACKWMTTQWGVKTIVSSWEACEGHQAFGLILCAHALEHMRFAPVEIGRMVESLEPGGELWIIVPDNSDPLNEDHLWFFTEKTLLSCLVSSGLIVEGLAIRKYIERENFIYAKARKPA